MESQAAAKCRSLADAAIAGVLFQAGLRRSKAAAWGKATAPRHWRCHAKPKVAMKADMVFGGLNSASIGRRLAAVARSTGHEGRVTDHSGRLGLASCELTARGASTTETMLAGGWKISRMVAHSGTGAATEQASVA